MLTAPGVVCHVSFLARRRRARSRLRGPPALAVQMIADLVRDHRSPSRRVPIRHARVFSGGRPSTPETPLALSEEPRRFPRFRRVPAVRARPAVSRSRRGRAKLPPPPSLVSIAALRALRKACRRSDGRSVVLERRRRSCARAGDADAPHRPTVPRAGSFQPTGVARMSAAAPARPCRRPRGCDSRCAYSSGALVGHALDRSLRGRAREEAARAVAVHGLHPPADRADRARSSSPAPELRLPPPRTARRRLTSQGACTQPASREIPRLP